MSKSIQSMGHLLNFKGLAFIFQVDLWKMDLNGVSLRPLHVGEDAGLERLPKLPASQLDDGGPDRQQTPG